MLLVGKLYAELLIKIKITAVLYQAVSREDTEILRQPGKHCNKYSAKQGSGFRCSFTLKMSEVVCHLFILGMGRLVTNIINMHEQPQTSIYANTLQGV